MSDSDYDTQYSALLPQFERILQSSNTASDKSAQLISLIKLTPTTACADALAIAVLNQVQVTLAVDTLAVTVKNVMDAANTQSIAVTEEDDPVPFKDIFSIQLSEFLKDRLHETELNAPKQTTITASNSTLSAALFSASVIKNHLLDGHRASYAFARQGLQLPGATQEPERQEVVSLGVCLQLSTAGTMMMEQWLNKSDGEDAVLQALKGLKERGVIRFSGGSRLLERTITIVENKFSWDLSALEAWSILFPDQ